METTREFSEKALLSLKKSVQQALKKKRLLGQYAIMGHKGKPVKVPAEQLPIFDDESHKVNERIQ